MIMKPTWQPGAGSGHDSDSHARGTLWVLIIKYECFFHHDNRDFMDLKIKV